MIAEIGPELRPTLIGMIFEIGVFVIFIVLLALIWRHYSHRKTEYTQKMFWIFTCYAFALLFSWVTKAINISLGAPDFPSVPTDIPGYWILARILQFRISFILMVIGMIITQVLRTTIFEARKAQAQNLGIAAFSLLTSLFAFFFVDKDILLYDVIAFSLVAVDMMLVYIPFAIASFRMRQKLEEPIYRRASLSLGVMALSFITIFVMFLIDRILILLGSPGYTAFYFLAWISSLVAVISVYIGYIRPGQVQKLRDQEARQNFQETILNPEL